MERSAVLLYVEGSARMTLPLLSPGPDARFLSSAKGSLEIWTATPRVVVQRCRGHASLGFAEAITKRVDPLLARGVRPILFDDWEELTGYDVEARAHLTAWTEKNEARIAGVHMLFRSRLVAMGVSVAVLSIRNIMTTYSDRAAFERALAEAVRGDRRLSSSPPGAP